jgi:hypothetical protein
VSAVELPGWRLAFHKRGSDGSAKCDLAPAPSATAYGAVYALSPVERPILDMFEGVGRGYEVRRLELDGLGPVFTYLAQPEYVDEALAPFDWYHRFVLEGARHHGFPSPYVEAIDEVEVLADPDPKRRASAAAVLERAQVRSEHAPPRSLG